MKIAIPCVGKSLEDSVNTSFGRSPYFILVESNSMSFEVVENIASKEQGGAGPKAATIIADHDVDALITFQCGENAANVFKVAQIDLLKAIPGSVEENILKYKSGELELLTEIHGGYHGHGGM